MPSIVTSHENTSASFTEHNGSMSSMSIPPSSDLSAVHRFTGGADHSSPRQGEAAIHTADVSSNAYFQPSPTRSQHPLNGTNGQQRRADKGRRLKPVSNAVIAAKTRLCVKFEKGTCTSPTCTFAHGSMELRKKPDLRKTKLCESFSTINSCAKGSECTYAHGIHELQATSEYFKTSICPNWKQGHCDAGAHCRHAHGTQELRIRPPVPKRTLQNVEISDVSTPESSSRFASATNTCEEKSKLLSTDDDTIITATHAARASAGRSLPIDTTDLTLPISNRSSMVVSPDESEELLHQPSSFPLNSLPPGDNRTASATSTNNQLSSAHGNSGYSQRPNPPGMSPGNRAMPTRMGTMPAGWQSSSARNTNRGGPSYPSSDPHHLTFHEPSAESNSAGFASADGVLFKSPSCMRRSLAVSAPAPPPPPPEPDGMSLGTLLPKPPATPAYPSGHRHQRQLSEVSGQRGLRRNQANHSDEFVDMRGASPSTSRGWNKQMLNNNNNHQQQQNLVGVRPLVWRSPQQQQHQQQPDVQQYDHRSSSNHSRAGGAAAFRSSNVVMNRQPANLKPPNKIQPQSVVECHSAHPSQPLLLFVNSTSRGLPPSAGASSGADTDSLSPIEYPPSAVALPEPFPVTDNAAAITNNAALPDNNKSANQHSNEDADATLPSSHTLHLNRPVFGYFPFDLPTVKESVPAQTPPTRGETHEAASLIYSSNLKANWTMCYGDRRASSIEFNPSNIIEGRSWGTRASSVVYPSGFNRRASRQSIKDSDGLSLKPAAAEAYPLAALVGKTMENNAPHRRRGTYADIQATRAMPSHSRNPSPRADELESPGGPASRKTTLSPRSSNQTNSSLRGGATDPRSTSLPQSDNRDLQQMRAAYLNQAAPQSPKRITTVATQAQELFAAFPGTTLQPPPPVLGQPATPPDPSHPIAEGTPLPPTFPPPGLAACDALSAAIGSMTVTPLLGFIPGTSAYQAVQQPVIAPSPLVVSPAILPPWTSSGMPARLTEGGHSFIPIVYSSPMLGCNLDVPIYVGAYAHTGGASSAATSRELTLLPFPAPAVAAQVMTRVEASHFVPPPPYHIGRKNSIFEYQPEPSAGLLGE